MKLIKVPIVYFDYDDTYHTKLVSLNADEVVYFTYNEAEGKTNGKTLVWLKHYDSRILLDITPDEFEALLKD